MHNKLQHVTSSSGSLKGKRQKSQYKSFWIFVTRGDSTQVDGHSYQKQGEQTSHWEQNVFYKSATSHCTCIHLYNLYSLIVYTQS